MTQVLQSVEVETGRDPVASVIWLHGLGADGHDFEPIVPELGPLPVPVRFVFPHAPTQPVTINGGMVMRAWYDILGFDLVRREDEAGVRISQGLLERLMAREEERGIARGAMVLAGFSQGGAIVLHTALRQARAVAGVMALSTYLPLAGEAPAESTAAGRATPIFFGHGTHDPIVPLTRAVQSRDILRGLGCTVEWHEYPMQHSVCMEEIAHAGAWLTRVLQPSAPA
jgi:phospholipase/carboxylesterase